VTVSLTAACGPSAADEGDAATTTSGATTASGETTASDATATTDPSGSTTTSVGDTSTTESADTSTSESSGASESTGGAGSVCDPQPEPVWAALDLDPETNLDEYAVDALCVVEQVEMRDEHRQRIELSCGEGDAQEPHVVEINAGPFVDVGLGIGETVGLRGAECIPIDYGCYEHVALRDAGGTLIAAMYGRLDPPAIVDVETWFAPFTFELRTDVCELEPYEPPDGGAFIQDECPTQDQRAAFEFTVDGESTLVYDSNVETIAGYEVFVPWAGVHYPQEFDWCGPRPITSARFTVLRPAA